MSIFLQKMGIDFDQLKALLSVSLRMELRQQLKKGKKQRLSPLVRSLLIYTGMSIMMGVNLVWRTTVESYCMFTLSYTMMMAALAIILEFHQILLMPDDLDILLHRPVSSTTYFWSRTIHLTLYVLFIGLALGLGPALIGLFLSDNGPGFPFIYFAATFLALIFTSSVMLWIYAVLIRVVRMEKFKTILAWLQFLIIFGLVFIYQFIARAGMSGKSQNIVTTSWMQWTPPGWFVQLIQAMQGRTNMHTIWQVSAIGTGVIVFGLISLRHLSMDYLGRLSETQAQSSRKTKKTPEPDLQISDRIGFIARYFHPETNAGWDFAWRMIRRDRSVQMSMLFLAAFPLVFLVFMWKDITLRDPFELRLAGSLPMNYHYILFIAVFISYMMVQGMAYVNDHEARWIYKLVPWANPARFVQGARWRVFTLFILPFYCLLTLAFLYYIPIVHAVQFGGFILLLGLIAYSLLALQMKTLPFSKERTRGDRTERFGFLLFGGPLIILMSLTQNLAYQSQTCWMILFIVLSMIFIFIEYLVIKKQRRLQI